jgi:RNA polymerase sigma-70 factor (ECF subfamily)
LRDAPDEELMARVQAQDAEAFGLLLDRHLAPLGRFLYRVGGNAADAEAIAQEAFLRIWKEAARWQSGRVKFSTWLYRIARNLAIDQHRRRREINVDALPERIASEEPVADLELETRRRRVREAVAVLPERQRTALLLCHFQGLSNPDAAQILEVSTEALESLLARARRTLKRALIDLET